MTVFWDVAPCSLVDVYQSLRGTCWWVIALIEAAGTSETLVNFYQTTWRYNPEDSHLRTYRRENLKFYQTTWRYNPEDSHLRTYRRENLKSYLF
jgi:hypothetical protein